MSTQYYLSRDFSSKIPKPLKVDLHVHTAEDPTHHIRYTAKELISLAADQGFDVLAITNHGCLTFNKKLCAYARERDILLIPGIEVTIRKRHVLLLNPPRGKAFPDFPSLTAMRRPDALVIAPHPYFPNPYSLHGLLLKHLCYFDALEYCHFYSPRINFNDLAMEVAEKHGLPVVGNSDAHFFSQFGTTYSLIHAEKDPEAIFQAIRQKKLKIVTHPLTPLKMGVILGKFARMKLLVEKRKRQKWLAARIKNSRWKPYLSSGSPPP